GQFSRSKINIGIVPGSFEIPRSTPTGDMVRCYITKKVASPVIPGLFSGRTLYWQGAGQSGHASCTDYPGAAMSFARWIPVPVAGVLLVILCKGDEQTAPSASGPVEVTAVSEYRGSGSCSAVACHGSIVRLDRSSSRVRRNEHTTWISDDPHSRAYQALFDQRSAAIVRSLAGE